MIILWPVAVVQIINFYRSPDNKKISIFKLDSQIKKSIPQLLRIGLVTFFYALVISTLLSPQMQSIVEQANAGDSVLDVTVFLKLILKLFLFMLPLFAATWFSPMIVVFRGEGVFKAFKIKYCSNFNIYYSFVDDLGFDDCNFCTIDLYLSKLLIVFWIISSSIYCNINDYNF